MTDIPTASPFAGLDFLPSLDQMQHWTRVLGQAQQLLMEHASTNFARSATPKVDFAALGELQAEMATRSIALWREFMGVGGAGAAIKGAVVPPPLPARDRRLSGPHWDEHPFFDLIRQSYYLVSEYALRASGTIDGLGARRQAQLDFLTHRVIEAMSPANFPLTNPEVIEKTIETGGENLIKGLRHLTEDLEKGQLRQTDTSAFELGVNIAATPGKVVHETPLYQLIQYAPTTDKLFETPVIIFPPWINRFYILDLSPHKSFVKWAVDQGLTVFMVSWKSADETMADMGWDDYVLRGQIDAIDTVRDLLKVPSVHSIGYCVAGTTLAMTLALLAARGQADKVASATFFTAQIDFSEAGDLGIFVDDDQLNLVDQLASSGYLDGRYMAATFNLLRGQDLVWNYVVNNYLLGKDYVPFDLLFWNSDTTNLPARWLKAYLADLYRDNKLVQPGAITIDGTPIDLGRIATPVYVQAGRDDHIAPAVSVWKMTRHVKGPVRFLLAGSGHIAGVVNPPAAGKYGYRTNDDKVGTLDDFIAGSTETGGSWWPDWSAWLAGLTPNRVAAKGARHPGKGKFKAIEDAPGSYVRGR